MNTRGNRAGFTVIELLAGLVAGSIIAVTAGAMLFYACRAWNMDKALVAAQRDATTAIYAIGRGARGAVTAVVSQAEFDVQRSDGVWKRFYVKAGDKNRLYCVEDLYGNATETPVTDYPVRLFTNGPVNDGVLVQLELQSDEGPVKTSTTIHMRN